jgi:ketosteroid isomerase-like protein
MALKDMKATTDDLILNGDIAVESGSYEMTLQPKGGKQFVDKGKYLTVWKRQTDGSWKIVRDINNTNLPAKS